jgi:hypothetical protein
MADDRITEPTQTGSSDSILVSNEPEDPASPSGRDTSPHSETPHPTLSPVREPQPITGLVRDVVQDAIEAIGDELSALATDSRTAINIRDGRPVGVAGPERLWSFEFDGGLPVPPETPARITVPERDPIQATILAIGDLDLVLGVRAELGEAVPHAQLSAEPWFIYDALRNRMDDMLQHGGDTALLEALLDLAGASDSPGPGSGASQLSLGLGQDQHEAVRKASAAGLRFVWGPPGTGKTATLAATVRVLATRPESTFEDEDHRAASELVAGPPERVLILAHANAAVDVAMVRVADDLDGSDVLAEGKVLRLGTPHLDIARERKEILPDQIIARQQPELVKEQEELQAERRSLSKQLKEADSEPEQQELAKRLEHVRAAQSENEKRLREARVELVKRATVIGATLSKVAIDDLLWSWPSTTVIVDEASMASLPFVMALAMRGARTLACYGDFRQLPPIAVSDRERAQQWFGRDVFTLANVVTRFEAGEDDSRLAVLRTQYRMGEDIAGLVGRLAYFDILKTDPDAAKRAAPVAELPPAPAHEVVVVDTTALGTTCQLDADPRSFSRFNLLSAAVATSVAIQLRAAGDIDVGIVTPSRAQARVLEALTREDLRITAATTHKFQGSERDAIVIDLVDADPQEGPSRLTGRDVDLALRLLNVAASRAKGKLVIVADLGFLDERHAHASPARQVVELATAAGAPTIGATELVECIRESPLLWYQGWEHALTDSVEHSADADHFDVNVPDESFAGRRLVRAVGGLAGRQCRVTVRAPAWVAVELEETDADLRLRTLGVAPLAFLGNEALVAGSRRPDGPAVRIASAALVSAARRVLLPTE